MEQDHRAACLSVLEEISRFGTLRREMAKSAAPDLHAGTASAVLRLAERGPARVSDLAADLRVDLSVVSRQAAELDAAGLVERQPDPSDGRACLLSLTPAGHEALNAVVERVIDRFQAKVAHWDATALAGIAADLQRLRADLLQPPLDGGPATRTAMATSA